MPFITRMQFIILGGNGFIGHFFTQSLLEAGHQVVVIHRGSRKITPHPQLVSVVMERRETERLARLIDHYRPDWLVDFIAYTAQDAWDWKGICEQFALPLLLISSGDVYEAYDVLQKQSLRPPLGMLTEEAPLRKQLFPYGQKANPADPDTPWQQYEKILVENLLRNTLPVPPTIARLALVYGPQDPRHRFAPYIKRMLDQRPYILLDQGKASWKWSRIFVRNAAHALQCLVEQGEKSRGKVYNLAEEAARTELEWLKILAEKLNWQGEICLCETHQLEPPLRENLRWEQDLLMDSSKIRTQLGYKELIPFVVGLEETITFEKIFHEESPQVLPMPYALEDRIYQRTLQAK